MITIALIVLDGCSSARKATADRKVGKLSMLEMEQMVSAHNNDYSWFSGKARVVVEHDDTRIGGTVQIRMLHNEFIWMSIQKFGFELARAYIRPDSAFIIDRFNKDFYAEGLEDYLAAYHIPFQFEELQGLILGNVPYEKGRRMRYRMEEGSHFLTQVTPDNLFFEYEAGSDLKIRRVLVKDPMDRMVLSLLGNYAQAGNREFPFAIEHFVEGGNQKVGMSIVYSSVEFDVEKNIPFEIPAHYSRIQ